MNIKVIDTHDGSKSLFLPEMNETYHSKFGAITESKHVFIRSGYQFVEADEISIFEVGFGTGLNVFLTYLEQQKDHRKIYFETIEKYPLPDEVIEQINIFENPQEKELFARLHRSGWEKQVALNENFILCKRQADLSDYQSDRKFDLVYFDAFAPNKQAEMWSEEIFQKMYDLLKEKGVLVTYSAKGSVRRTMQAVGFTVERIPGPPGKREMLRAMKL